jgi:hypothetical protein
MSWFGNVAKLRQEIGKLLQLGAWGGKMFVENYKYPCKCASVPRLEVMVSSCGLRVAGRGLRVRGGGASVSWPTDAIHARVSPCVRQCVSACVSTLETDRSGRESKERRARQERHRCKANQLRGQTQA